MKKRKPIDLFIGDYFLIEADGLDEECPIKLCCESYGKETSVRFSVKDAIRLHAWLGKAISFLEEKQV